MILKALKIELIEFNIGDVVKTLIRLDWYLLK